LLRQSGLQQDRRDILTLLAQLRRGKPRNLTGCAWYRTESVNVGAHAIAPARKIPPSSCGFKTQIFGV
jgi:hypothetical protein